MSRGRHASETVLFSAPRQQDSHNELNHHFMLMPSVSAC
ncbi:hypothetical protein SLEP1_g6200 [Rubroshorea leprosula]|uniref:Uncharacterized protein n=1 Tax=Rubroshorea leprosula TaxID=152421 RepID=A0AAV5HUG6_9ROSI|nr:hypothetical protein SLEP1_g6200 [Rubroshorea leprosula]